MREDTRAYTIESCPVCGNTGIVSCFTRSEYAQQKKDVFKFLFHDCMCNRCGFVFTKVRPSEDYLSDYYAQYLENLSEVSELEIEERLGFLAEAIYTGMRILEIGGGHSAFSDELRLRGAQVLNYDLSINGGLDISRQRDLDLICSYYVGEHVNHINEWIDMQRLMLRNGGLLLIEVPNFKDFPVESMNNEHINHFSMYNLELLLHLHGFRVIKSQENSAGRYFGMTILAQKEEALLEGHYSQDNYKRTVNLDDIKAGLHKVEVYNEKLNDCADWLRARVKENLQVAIWPSNELTTSVLSRLNKEERDRISLFDIDSRKEGMTWFDCSRPVLIPTRETISSCQAFCVLSPTYEREIANDIIRMHRDQPLIYKFFDVA